LKKLIFLLPILLFCFGTSIYAQNKIDYDADRVLKNEQEYPGAMILRKATNQVYFNHEGIEVWCDLAIFYRGEDFFKAYGNVKMVQGDSIVMNSEYAEYDGNTKFAFASKNVSLRTPKNTLTTDTLFLNRNKQQAFYRSGGTLRDSASVITSRIGRYYMDAKKYSFITDVQVKNPEYTINTQQLDFYNETGHAYLYGSTTILGETSKIYCERGFYDTRGDMGYFVKNSTVYYENRKLRGDSIFFDRKRGFASATNFIKVTDTINQSVVTGHYAEVFREKDSVFITKRAVVSTLQGGGSLHIHSDTLFVTGKPQNRIIRGFYNVRIYGDNGMSGKSDSIHLNEKIGLTQMLGNPVLWFGAGQITGDTIHLLSKNIGETEDSQSQELDSLRVFENAFIIQQDSIKGFNQVKGKRMYGLFEENELYEVNLIQNTETIYYLRNDEDSLVGIDKTESASIKMLIQNRQIEDIYYYNKVDGIIYPEEELPENARKLSGFNWRGEERLLSKEALFEDEPPLNLPKIQGIPLPDDEETFFEENQDGESPVLNEHSQLNSKILKPQKADSIPPPKTDSIQVPQTFNPPIKDSIPAAE